MQRSRHLAFAVAVAIAVVAAASGAAPATARTYTQAAPAVSATNHTNREVFGFALGSSLADPSVGYPSWNFDLLTTVAYFGVHVDTAGRFVGDSGWSTWNSSDVANLVSVAHQHGTKVLLTVILQDFSPNTPNMCAGLMHSDATVSETLQEVKAKSVDGVNIDYEGLNGSCGQSDPNWAQHAMTAFVQKMRAGLGASYYLSVDTYASSAVDGYGFFDVAGIANYADSLFVMAYDLEYSNYSRPPSSCARFCLGPTSPLSAYYYNDVAVSSQYVSAVGAAKTILGVPYYGRKACVGGAVPNAYPTSGVVADSYLDASTEATDPAVEAGSYASHRDPYSSGGERWDTWYNTSLGCTRELYWDDATSLGKKYDLVNSAGLRGVGIWNLNYGGGSSELWGALASHFAACRGAGLSASPGSPQRTGTRVTLTATSSGCPNPRYQFFMRAAADSGWQVVQAYGASAMYSWNSAGAVGIVYFGIWVRDASSTAPLDSNTSIAYTVSGSCAIASLSASPGSVASGSGSHVILTASASGCATSPRYQFLLRTTLQSDWQVIQSYSAAPTYDWNSAGAAAGTLYLGLWARDSSSSAQFDAATSVPFTVSSVCSSVAVTVSPATVAGGSGTHVTVTAQVSGCAGAALYEYWLRPATSITWQIVQAYGTGSTYDWNTTGAPAGTFYMGVHVKGTNSTAAVDAVASAPVTVSYPCASVTVSASPASVARGSGAHVTVTATAAGCANPRYEFWIRPASSTTWRMVQAYGTGNTYDWNSAGAAPGSVYIGVRVRDAGSNTSYDALGNSPVTVS